MSVFNLALFNAKNNIKLYAFNIISMVFSIAVFFNFFSLIFNPDLNLSQSDKAQIKITLYMVTILLTFFILFFILYSNSFFLKQRKKEIGIYTFMGIESNQIAMSFSIEVLILGVTSLVLGLASGILFQKVFLMLLNKVADMNTEIKFYLSLTAIIVTTVIFMLIFLVSAFRGFRSIQKSKLIDLLNAEKKEEKFLKTRYITGILSIILIGIAYYFSKDIFSAEIFTYSSLVMFCVIAGTFLLFSSFTSIIIKFMVSNKRFLYKGTNIISISNIVYRIRYNYKTLACIALIVAATITSIGTAFSIEHLFLKTVEITHPYSFSYISDNENLTKEVKNVINKSEHKIESEVNTSYLLYNSQNDKFPKYHPIIKISDFNNIIEKLDIDDKSEVKNKVNNLEDGESTSVSSTNDSGFKDDQTLDMLGISNKVKETLDIPLLGSRFSNNTLIFTDNDYYKYKEETMKLNNEQYKERIFTGINVSNPKDTLELYKELVQIEELNRNLNSYVTYYISYTELTGVIKFTGLFLGVVFIIITASIMYMRIMSDALLDKEKYTVLNKLGLSHNELNMAISKQVGFSYILPLIVGIIHGFMAIGVLQGFLNEFITISLLKPFLISLVIYFIIYIVFYLITTNKFVNMINN